MTKKVLKKILLVDDDQDILNVARYCLEELKDIEIKYLSSGEEAIKEALTFQPDLILLDVMMPKMDGITALKAIRLLPSMGSVPVIFFTAKVQKEEISTYHKNGVIDIITKPFDPMTLASRILEIWNRYQSK
ncbi:MAG: response regulator [Chlamydiae bacterium]|nr:response regulator [Chlamydiota bacterium]